MPGKRSDNNQQSERSRGENNQSPERRVECTQTKDQWLWLHTISVNYGKTYQLITVWMVFDNFSPEKSSNRQHVQCRHDDVDQYPCDQNQLNIDRPRR